MTEYVFRIDESHADIMGGMPCERREKVVRCRDCGRAYRRGGGVYCSCFLQWGSNDKPAPLLVNPDGFCAWGERKDGQCTIG